MLKAVNHVQITIPSGAQSEAKAFYCDVLGLIELAKPDSLKGNGSFWLLLGEVSIHFAVEDADYRSQTSSHIAYEVTDILFWRDKLTSLGIKVFEDTPIPGVERFNFRDPFGNRVEMMEIRTTS
ncbi:VOC family protein [Vibrio nigripulchritudo]|uniref:VOC family protein n=1 Tax=Vibrio nigripulchritudo TaxID=28173 RepID=UPI0005FA63A6|nr:VOC family protein [Vibrio nigripulchritudo]KJY81006.1 glyoxalase [Vibrio nigripulchritudo]